LSAKQLEIRDMVLGRVRLARIDDMDRPLHRIFPVWHFERACRLRQLVLVKPALWIDPREDPCAMFFLQPQSGAQRRAGRQMADYLAACWAQCWSYEADSDVLLRAYSRVVLDPLIERNTTPAEEGIRVTTTARRLIEAVTVWAEQNASSHFYLAPVIYGPEDQFDQSLVAQFSRPEGPRFFSTPDGRADSLFVKRDRFGHEQEVRLLCVGDARLGEGPNILTFPIDPNSLFTEVAFDPRLIAFERSEREESLRKCGYTGTIREDISYVKVLTAIPMKSEWPSPAWDDVESDPSSASS